MRKDIDYPAKAGRSLKMFVILPIAIFLASCDGFSAGVSGVCDTIRPHLHSYSEQDKSDISLAIKDYPPVRKVVETAVGIKEVYDGECKP